MNTNDIDVINKEKMVSILIEMHLTEESVMELKLPEDTSETFFTEKEKEIFRKYRVDEEKYRKSYSYYFFTNIYKFFFTKIKYFSKVKNDS